MSFYFCGVRVTRSLVFCAMFCRSLFVHLSFFFWPLRCPFFDLRILITPLVSSSSSWLTNVIIPYIIYYVMFLQNWYPRETSLLFTGRQMLCSMSIRKCIRLCIPELQSWPEVKNTNMKFMKTQDKNTQISVYSPVYIRQKRRDIEQIATEGFLSSSWSWVCPH